MTASKRPRKPRKIGRPTKYSKALSTRICARLAIGHSMRKISQDDKYPSMETMFRWLRIYPEFRDQYEIAKQESADSYADEIVDIADEEALSDLIIDGIPVLDPETDKPYRIVTSTGVQHARLRVDARKWVASKLKPKKYGDKVEQTHVGRDGKDLNWTVEFVNADLNKKDEGENDVEHE